MGYMRKLLSRKLSRRFITLLAKNLDIDKRMSIKLSDLFETEYMRKISVSQLELEPYDANCYFHLQTSFRGF